MEQPSGELAVHLGLGEMYPSMRQLSLIGVPVMLPNGVSAVIAVLVRMRMNYGRVISAVQHVGEAFDHGAGCLPTWLDII
jgi:transcriptional regulator of heat shock response